MKRHLARSGLLLGLLVSVLLVTPASASAAARGPSWGAKLVDLALVRPLSLVGSAASTALCLGTLPLTYPTGLSYGASDWLITAAWRFTGGRPLGEYDRYIDGRSITGGY